MCFATKTTSSCTAYFWITIYLIISFSIFVATSGGYQLIFFVYFNAPIYLVMWISLTITCVSSRIVRYRPTLLGLIFIVQTISVMVNSRPTAGSSGTSDSVNFIQTILTKPPYLDRPWFEYQVFVFFAALYTLLLIVFLIDLDRSHRKHIKNPKELP